MYRLSTIRRRLLLGTGSVLVLTGLLLTVVHTGLVRRFALVQIQARLGNALGLVLDARELDYDLLVSRLELREISIRGARSKDMPPPLQAHHLLVTIPFWRLVTGSFDAARIQIDGLSVDLLTTSGGRTNLPDFPSQSGARPSGPVTGPAVLITGGSFRLEDDRSGTHLVLPIGRISAGWEPSRSAYQLLCDLAGGQLQWGGTQVPIDRIQLRSVLAGGGLKVEALQLQSGESRADITGLLDGNSRITASGLLDLSLPQLNDVLKLGKNARGQLRVRVSAQGSLTALEIKTALEGRDFLVDGIPMRELLADASIDTAGGELKVESLSAGLFSGVLKGRGRIALNPDRRTAFTAAFRDFDLRQAARAIGITDAPPGRALVEIDASGPGLDWQRAALSGALRLPGAKVGFRAHGDGRAVRASIQSTVGDSTEVRADVACGFTGGSLHGAVSGDTTSLAQLGVDLETLLGRPSGSLTVPGVDGAATWSATLSGSIRYPTASLQLEAKGLAAAGLKDAELQLNADYSGDRVGIARATLLWAGQQAAWTGEVRSLSANPQLQLDGTIQGQSLTSVFQSLGAPPSVEAAVAGEFRVSGDLANPEAQLALHAATLTAYSRRFTNAALNAQWKDGKLTLGKLAADEPKPHGDPGRIDVTGTLTPSTREFEVRAIPRNLEIAADDGEAIATGTIGGEIHAQGTLDDPTVKAEILAAGVKIGAIPLGDVRTSVNAEGHRATAEFSLPALNTHGAATIGMEGDWPFEVKLDSEKTRVDTSPAAAFDANVHAAGTLSGFEIRTASANIRNLSLTAEDQQISGDGPITLSYEQGRIHVGQLALKSGSSTLRVAGEIPADDTAPPGSLSIQGSLDLAPLSRVFPDPAGSTVTGVVEVSGSVSGTLQKWQPSGSLTIRDAIWRAQ
jgi:autotransporter translocation and assembly factor TamB